MATKKTLVGTVIDLRLASCPGLWTITSYIPETATYHAVQQGNPTGIMMTEEFVLDRLVATDPNGLDDWSWLPKPKRRAGRRRHA